MTYRSTWDENQIDMPQLLSLAVISLQTLSVEHKIRVTLDLNRLIIQHYLKETQGVKLSR